MNAVFYYNNEFFDKFHEHLIFDHILYVIERGDAIRQMPHSHTESLTGLIHVVILKLVKSVQENDKA